MLIALDLWLIIGSNLEALIFWSSSHCFSKLGTLCVIRELTVRHKAIQPTFLVKESHIHLISRLISDNPSFVWFLHIGEGSWQFDMSLIKMTILWNGRMGFSIHSVLNYEFQNMADNTKGFPSHELYCQRGTGCYLWISQIVYQFGLRRLGL